jgi:hypothetical protein
VENVSRGLFRRRGGCYDESGARSGSNGSCRTTPTSSTIGKSTGSTSQPPLCPSVGHSSTHCSSLSPLGYLESPQSLLRRSAAAPSPSTSSASMVQREQGRDKVMGQPRERESKADRLSLFESCELRSRGQEGEPAEEAPFDTFPSPLNSRKSSFVLGICRALSHLPPPITATSIHAFPVDFSSSLRHQPGWLPLPRSCPNPTTGSFSQKHSRPYRLNSASSSDAWCVSPLPLPPLQSEPLTFKCEDRTPTSSWTLSRPRRPCLLN